MATKSKHAADHYRICESILEFDVANKVSELMADGWLPYGNLIVTQKPEDTDGNQYEHYAQAMIKPATKK